MAAENSKRFNFRHEENSRKTSMEEAWEDAVHHIKMKKDKVGCEVRQINDIIGKGVFAVKDFKEGEFVLEYDGEYITREEGRKREKTYPLSLGSYIFFFLKVCIDATFSTRIGRYVNDSPSADPKSNTEMLRIQMEDRYHLVLFAKRYIHAGEEIRYDYGVTGLSWRKVPKEQRKTTKKIKETDQVKDCFVRLTRLPVKQLTKLDSKNKGVEESTAKQARVYGPEFAVESVSVVEIGIALPLEEPIRDCAVESMVEMVEEQINRSGIQMSKQDDETRRMVAVMGHFHQCTPQQFRHAAAGTQCTSICITAIVAAALRAVKDWTSDFIDEVLVGGDQLHLDILQKKGWPFNRFESMLDIDEIPDTIQCQIGINGIKASIGVLEEGSFGYSSYIDTLITSALVNKPNQSFILRMFGSSIAILCTGHQKYSIFDPHARNQNGDIDANGYAGLFHFRDSSEMVAYLKDISSGRNEQIDIYPILVNILWRTPINRTEDSFVPEVTCSATTDMHDGVQETSDKSLNIPSPKACSPGESVHDSEIPAPITPLQKGTLNLQNQNFTDVDLDALEEFIGLVAEDIPFCQLLDFSRLIQEEDVTVQPETLMQSKSLLMNKKLQNCAKQFFTEDAWLAVKTTLQFLGGLKGDIEIDTSEEEVPGPSKRKIPRVVTSEIEDIAPSGGESENVADLQGKSEDEMFDDLELENEETESLTAVKKTRHMWLPEEDEAIRHFFKSEISDVSRKGNQGTLQVCKKIHTFISKNPVVLKDYDFKEKVKKIRIKVINLRRQNRQRYFKYMKKIQHN